MQIIIRFVFEYTTPEMFNKLFESIRPDYTEDNMDVEDYLSGKAVIAEFEKKKEEPKPEEEKKEEAKPEEPKA